MSHHRPGRHRATTARPFPARAVAVGTGLTLTVIAGVVGVSIIASAAAPRQLPPPPNNPGSAQAPVSVTSTAPAADPPAVIRTMPASVGAQTATPAVVPEQAVVETTPAAAVVSAIQPGGSGFGWAPSAFGSVPPAG